MGLSLSERLQGRRGELKGPEEKRVGGSGKRRKRGGCGRDVE